VSHLYDSTIFGIYNKQLSVASSSSQVVTTTTFIKNCDSYENCSLN